MLPLLAFAAGHIAASVALLVAFEGLRLGRVSA
jgi:hypothetical protein